MYTVNIFIFLIYADENGDPRILRFNTETKEMEDLTEKTGNCILPDFFYNGEIYGREFPRGDYYRTKLDLSEAELVDSFPVVGQFYGSIFFDNAYDDFYDKLCLYNKFNQENIRSFLKCWNASLSF